MTITALEVRLRELQISVENELKNAISRKELGQHVISIGEAQAILWRAVEETVRVTKFHTENVYTSERLKLAAIVAGGIAADGFLGASKLADLALDVVDELMEQDAERQQNDQ